MKHFDWKEMDINIPADNGEEYTLHVKYLPSEFDNKLK